MPGRGCVKLWETVGRLMLMNIYVVIIWKKIAETFGSVIVVRICLLLVKLIVSMLNCLDYLLSNLLCYIAYLPNHIVFLSEFCLLCY